MTPGFSGATLDRQEPWRHAPERLAAAQRDPAARVMVLTDLEPAVAGAGLDWRPMSDAPAGAPLLFLGTEAGAPRFAAAVPGGETPLVRSAGLMTILDALPAAEAGAYAAARSLAAWHARAGFCANCGTATDAIRGGWARSCPRCQAEHYPRTDPVVIMLAEHGDRVLLGRQPSWPERRWSALAGFLEVGESIEAAVRRETLEEAGVPVGAVRYVASQPWPFPSQLMIACIGTALDDAITVDPSELEAAMWVTRAEVQAALSGAHDARFLPPPPYAIARTLLEHWATGS